MNPKALVLIAVSFVGLASCAPSPNVETFGVFGLSAQRISGKESLTFPGASGFEKVSILVTVGTDGKVLEAEVARNDARLDAGPALAAARQWVFRPQSFEGRPIRAIGEITIAYDAPEIPPDRSVPFPAAAPDDIEIILERSACFGSCPDYQVSIRGDGKVRFSTFGMDVAGTAAEVHRMFNVADVLWPGSHEATVSPRAVAALLDRFRAAHFMGLRDQYEAPVTDNPTYVLTLRIGNTTKRVIDYVGEEVGMPASVTALEDAVDALAGTDRWVRGNRETVALLKAEGFDFGSEDAAEIVMAAIRINEWRPDRSNADELIRAMMAAGLDLTTSVSAGAYAGATGRLPIGVAIAGYAARTGNEPLFDEMARRGQVARMSKHDLQDAFVAGAGCSTKIAKALVAAGADPRSSGEQGNALHAMRSGYGSPCFDKTAAVRTGMARTLVDLGVPLEAHDDLGWTPLMGSNDPDVVQMLLAAGADPNARAADGRTPVLSTDDDRVVVLLLRAGADPNVKDRRWPATLRWLDSHGVR